jgi:hypothetical protein
MRKEVTLAVSPSHSVFDRARHAIANLSDGKLKLTGSTNAGNDTDFTYTLYLSRRDGRKPTKSQVLWAETTIKAIEYVLR